MEDEVEESVSSDSTSEKQSGKTMKVKSKVNVLSFSKTFSEPKDINANKAGRFTKDHKGSLRKVQTFKTSADLDLIDWFSNNVVSERVRNDPREKEKEKEVVVFEAIEEIDSDSASEILKKIDEDIDEDLKMIKYKSGKDILGSNGLDDKPSKDTENYTGDDHDYFAAESIKLISMNNLTSDSSVSKINNTLIKGATQPRIVFDEINDDSDFSEIFESSTSVIH